MVWIPHVESSIDAQIARLAAQQFGVFCAQQLRDAGIDRQAVGRRLRSGIMVEVFPRVYAHGPAAFALPREALLMAAVLAGGRGAALGIETAAELLGILRRPGGAIDVLLPIHRTPPARHGVKFRRVSTTFGDVITHGGMPITASTRTILDLGIRLSPFQIAAVMHEAAFLGMLDVDDIASRLDRCRSVPGTRSVRDALQLHQSGSAGTRSRSEDRLLDALLATKGPRPLVNVRHATGIHGVEADLVFPLHQLVIEVDGPGHLRPGIPEHDRSQDAMLTDAGWRVIRITSSRVWHDLPHVIEEIEQALASRSCRIAART